MAEHGIRHYSLEIFGVGCAIHETIMFYPEIGNALGAIPHFEKAFGVVMGIVFLFTLGLWLFFGLIRAWRYLFPAPLIADVQNAGTLPTVTSGVPAIKGGSFSIESKTQAMNASIQIAEFQKGTALRVQDIKVTYENYAGRLELLKRCLQHNEEAKGLRYSPMPAEEMTPREIRDARESLVRDERAFKQALDEMSNFIGD